MSKKNIIIIISAVLVFIVALVIFLYGKSLTSKNNSSTDANTTNPPVAETNPVKECYFYDIDENKYYLEDFSGKPIVILLWKSDNAKSYAMLDLITKYYDVYKDKLYFLPINVNESDIDLYLIENVKAAGFKIPIYFDTAMTLQDRFDYEKLPALLFISQDGEIENKVLENIYEDSFTANLDLLIFDY